MRMLLIFTAGVALMSAPAFAQSTDTPSDSGQPSTTAPGAPPDSSMPPPPPPPSDTGQPPAQQPGVTDQNQPGVTSPDTSQPTQGQSRLYQSAPQVSGQNVQIITNGPVPDNRINRARYRPLSRLGRETRARGN